MVQAYNFLASWQLFPEKGTYENGAVTLHVMHEILPNGSLKIISMKRIMIVAFSL